MNSLFKKTSVPVLVACIMPLWLLYAEEKPEVSLETKTKAVFLYNFTKFIQWPEDDTASSFKVAVLGASDIYFPLLEISQKQKVDLRPLIVKKIETPNGSMQPHILFISPSMKGKLKEILKNVHHPNILTVSDSEGFAAEGTAINFVVRDGKVKFEINSAALDRTHLKVSSQLLKLAIFVEEE